MKLVLERGPQQQYATCISTVFEHTSTYNSNLKSTTVSWLLHQHRRVLGGNMPSLASLAGLLKRNPWLSDI